MVGIKLLSQGTTSDMDAMRSFVSRMVRHIADNEPGITEWEAFVDLETSQVMFVEHYADDEALLTHISLIDDFMAELWQIYSIESFIVLGTIADPSLAEALEGAHALMMQPLLGGATA
jgi:quinol monooxygenase YgiN